MAPTTALYLRLSVDDDNRDESNSIANQRDLLSAYVAAKPSLSAGEVLTFADDGWSGTNFQRPQVTALLDIAKRGGIQCIVVKDLSRWGRNYPEVSEYLDQIFPFLGIRFISLGEGYDSHTHKGQTAPMDIAFGTIMHDVYSKELSVKVRQSYVTKTKNGEFLCGSPPFGFVKSTIHRNRLEVDREAADIVFRIFSLACDGNSNTRIAAVLNNDGIDTPLMYRKRKGMTLRGAHSAVSSRTYWTSETVRKILIDERYAGVMVSGKQRIASPGSRKIEYLPESEWIRIPDSHEAVVSEDMYRQANANMWTAKKSAPVQNRSLLSGKVKCGCCGKSLEYAATKVNPYYCCRGARVNSGMGCFEGRLPFSNLSEIVLTAVKAEAQKMLDAQRQYRKYSQSQGSSANIVSTSTKSAKTALSSELAKLTASEAQLKRQGISLFEWFADSNISQESYIAAVQYNDEELGKVRNRIEYLNCRLSALLNATDISGSKADGAVTGVAAEPVLKRILGADLITDECLAMIDRIIIYDTRHIEVRFAFGDANVTAGAMSGLA